MFRITIYPYIDINKGKIIKNIISNFDKKRDV